jgi:hypothetical protein
MVYDVSFQTKLDAQDPHSKFIYSFFIESESAPDHERVVKAVEKYSNGDFAPDSVTVEQRADLEGTELEKHSPFVKLD